MRRQKHEESTSPYPAQSHAQPLAEREKMGKALRTSCPRKSHAVWTPPPSREDPIAVLIRNSEGRVKRLIPLRYGRMLPSPFTFLRGAASVMADDLSTTPTTGVVGQICGDCHLLNFGGFATPERRLIFDINDFDETAIGPWEWDVKRLAASFVLAGRNNRLSRSVCLEAAWAAARSYQEHMLEIADTPLLEAWYSAVDQDYVRQHMRDASMRRFCREKITKETKQNSHVREFAHMAHLDGDRQRILDDPPIIYHPREMDDESFIVNLRHSFQRYLDSLPPERRVLLERYQMVDAAIKVVGVGSVGTLCGVMLLMSGNGNPLFLQFKEARTSVLEAHCGRSAFAHSGERVVVGQRLMQAASDICLGWTTGDHGRFFYVRQLRDVKIRPMVEIMKASNLENYAGLCGYALARAHARSLDAVVLAAYLGKSEEFPDAMAAFGKAYADQSEADHELLVEAVRSGRVEAKTGV